VTLARFNMTAMLLPLLLIAALTLMTAPATQASQLQEAGDAKDAEVAGEHSLKHVSPDLHEILAIPGEGRKLQITLILFQLAAILLAAKLLGAFAEWCHVPGVIGELVAGVIVGPYLLGSYVPIPMHGEWVPLFPKPVSIEQWPVNEFLWAIAQLSSIVLLFVTGLHTDLKQFMRYVLPATLIALAGAVIPFGLGMGVVYIPMFGDLSTAHPSASPLVPALFVGVIMMATSIGITARVLSDIEKLDTPEGVTILGAAVLDDVLGIVALSIVGGIAATGTVSAGSVGWISIKAFGIWIVLTVVILMLARPIERVLTRIPYGGTMIALALALAFICSGVAEFFGLAFIIGAYSVGLGLSRTQMSHKLMELLRPLSDFIVPIFFATLGMLVNFNAMLSDWRVIVFGLVVTVAAVVGKLLGCGAAALPVGFNARGAYRIGLGMLPRGEVALIVAGVGLSQNIIGQNVFGVSIMMTLLTTVIAPMLLVPAFKKGGSGRRHPEQATSALPAQSTDPAVDIRVPADMAGLIVSRLLKTAEANGWEGSYERSDEEIYLLRKEADAAQIRCRDGKIEVDATGKRQPEFAEYFKQVQREIAGEVMDCRAQADLQQATE
jgi:Kef-type K+ transport system membrane component KefB